MMKTIIILSIICSSCFPEMSPRPQKNIFSESTNNGGYELREATHDQIGCPEHKIEITHIEGDESQSFSYKAYGCDRYYECQYLSSIKKSMCKELAFSKEINAKKAMFERISKETGCNEKDVHDFREKEFKGGKVYTINACGTIIVCAIQDGTYECKKVKSPESQPTQEAEQQ
jgi:hypothetical protein